jgi:hypothetical protein
LSLSNPRIAASVLLGAGTIALACGPLRTSGTGSDVPINSCSASPCTAYVQENKIDCTEAGVCAISSPVDTTDLVVLVSPPDDAFFAPGVTFAIPYSTLATNAVVPITDSSSVSELPALVTVPTEGQTSCATDPNDCLFYAVSPKLAEQVGWDLGPAATAGNFTSLPFHATFHLLWPQNGGLVEAQSLGLPLLPIQADPIVQSTLGLVGPGGGPTTAFQASLPPAIATATTPTGPAWTAMYEETWTPDPPFDEAFAPVTQIVTLANNSWIGPQLSCQQPFDPTLQAEICSYDVTGGAAPTNPTGGVAPTNPQLQISRQNGVLDGWTAYLRDAETQRTISNVALLHGPTASVFFAVKRPFFTGGQPESFTTNPPQVSVSTSCCNTNQMSPDALSGVVLVVAPPANDPEPTGVFNLFDALSPVLYPTVPPAVTLTGYVTSTDGASVDATLIFEATSVVAPNFEFTTSVTATNGMPYSVTLTPGQYQVDVRPLSPEPAISIQSVTIPPGPPDQPTNFVLDASRTVVTGSARIVDERVLAGASVDAIPLQCVSSATNTSGCLPRSTSVSTDANGEYALTLDPGAYTLRVRPADGSHLPWVVLSTPLVVDGVNIPPPSDPIVVRAPMSLGLTLYDPNSNAIANALVRVFRLPASSPAGPVSSTAIEVGEAITDSTGHYDMYVAPP